MRRNSANLKIYRETIQAVYERADGRCEVLVDLGGRAIWFKHKRKSIKRCSLFIPFEQATYTNFLHVATRNGKSDEWINNPDNITFGCAQHHYEEAVTGKHVLRCVYSEITYIPEV